MKQGGTICVKSMLHVDVSFTAASWILRLVNLLVILQSLEVSSIVSSILCTCFLTILDIVSWQVVLNTCSAASCVCWWLDGQKQPLSHTTPATKNLDEYQSEYTGLRGFMILQDSWWSIHVDLSWFHSSCPKPWQNHLAISYLFCTFPVRTGKSWIVGGRRTVGDWRSFADLLSASFSLCAAAHGPRAADQVTTANSFALALQTFQVTFLTCQTGVPFWSRQAVDTSTKEKPMLFKMNFIILHMPRENKNTTMAQITKLHCFRDCQPLPALLWKGLPLLFRT